MSIVRYAQMGKIMHMMVQSRWLDFTYF